MQTKYCIDLCLALLESFHTDSIKPCVRFLYHIWASISQWVGCRASLIHDRHYWCWFSFSLAVTERSIPTLHFKQVWAFWECCLQQSALCLRNSWRLRPITKTPEKKGTSIVFSSAQTDGRPASNISPFKRVVLFYFSWSVFIVWPWK